MCEAARIVSAYGFSISLPTLRPPRLGQSPRGAELASYHIRSGRRDDKLEIIAATEIRIQLEDGLPEGASRGTCKLCFGKHP